MKIKDIDWKRCCEISSKTENDDEYKGMTWGCPEDIDYLCECLWAFKEKEKSVEIIEKDISTVFGVPILRIQKILDYFYKKGYDPKDDEFEKQLEVMK